MSSIGLPRRVHAQDEQRLLRHFLQLDSNDRRYRFGSPVSDGNLQDYVQMIDLQDDTLFAVEDTNLHFVGVGHLSMDAEHAHIGVSVLQGWRGKGVAKSLVRRCLQRARNADVEVVHMTRLMDNRPMAVLEKKLGFVTFSTDAETEAEKTMSGLTLCSLIAEGLDDWLAAIDHNHKVQHLFIRKCCEGSAPATEATG
ncbi:acetyltransferase (GNAT) family protein [Roseibium hamelinense]|uniref:Acetyltransferase (GNAT) family protein n=1 Tax=Roseibium hamelinense TaxID=150831 RepID=A0A562SHR9_9HYPH|nr:GNAT family N-acetyltransferase [Roseibium hamelinense]MTI43868.1 GNAT family N-acetyltransferase [Roseibium hamelinense]TWI80841.1 acetyltransferase (GNAT) family protein [Roseibium hamelinense]